MAAEVTAKEATKVVRLIDPTTLASHHAVRFPSISGKIIQGRTRFPNSRAAIHFVQEESARLKKSLQRITHGRNIFAYYNMRTNQVVYSLSRNLDRNNVFSQLVYHGKKTVPAQLRKDMWIPYYSVHFSSSRVGLHAYKLVREFSQQRQFSPPEEIITVSEETMARKRPRDLNEAEKWDKKWNAREGQLMPKKERARVLMDQKATSVADIAAALKIANEREQAVKQEEEEAASQEEGVEVTKKKKLSLKAQKRVRQAARQNVELENRVREKVAELEQMISTDEVEAKIDMDGALGSVPEGQVRMMWVDLQDAQYASSWPSNVGHAEVEPTNKHLFDAKPVEETPESTSESQPPQPEQSAPTEGSEGKKDDKSGINRLKFW